jgi:hypothetical protein
MWWQSLSLFEQITFSVALAASGIIFIFLILMVFGIDGSDYDGDFGAEMDFINDEPLTGISGLRILTVRGVLVFIAIGCWLGFILFKPTGPLFAVLIGALGGVIAAYLQALAFRASLKLESSGNIDYRNAIGKEGTVYLRIPKSRSGKGKVTVVIQERFTEVDAVTDELEDLLPKSLVEITGLEDNLTVQVKKKSK